MGQEKGRTLYENQFSNHDPYESLTEFDLYLESKSNDTSNGPLSFTPNLSPLSLQDLGSIHSSVNNEVSPNDLENSGLDSVESAPSSNSAHVPSPSSLSNETRLQHSMSNPTSANNTPSSENHVLSDFGGNCAILDNDKESHLLEEHTSKLKWPFHKLNEVCETSRCNSGGKRGVGILRRFLPSSRLGRLNRVSPLRTSSTTGIYSSLDSPDITPLSVSTTHLHHPSVSNSRNQTPSPSLKTDLSSVDVKQMDVAERSKCLDALLEDILQLDSAYDTVEKRMMESGWSSMEEIRDVHAKRLDAWQIWKRKLLPLRGKC
ncbi:Schizosaccharomyces specific protein [Schizosaccharomyces osmophilus]|uniref:Schizosaccharomyces specific protein n=1 Tax=Schizosaccharomyces osmophilus TaxID=2545709 RepID=A0AAE9WDR0_9SCHI|nr:Schizosaccharomyces specific protein [Schizosaccharomyces osmophilus]WBW72833.1 Schizosaccharomyces specific protein [Schizosaccharomyces osmophilus]